MRLEKIELEIKKIEANLENLPKDNVYYVIGELSTGETVTLRHGYISGHRPTYTHLFLKDSIDVLLKERSVKPENVYEILDWYKKRLEYLKSSLEMGEIINSDIEDLEAHLERLRENPNTSTTYVVGNYKTNVSLSNVNGDIIETSSLYPDSWDGILAMDLMRKNGNGDLGIYGYFTWFYRRLEHLKSL